MGHYLIVPAALNASKIKLFILDTGIWTTTISPQAAREVTKVHSGAPVQVRGMNGEVQKVYETDEIIFRFAHLEQKVKVCWPSTLRKSQRTKGLRSPVFWARLRCGQLTIHIDYRDGLVKFDYDPKRGYSY